jgi:Luciferase-like monooxygenase
MAKLRFGYFIAPFHRAGTNPTLALQRDLEFIEHLDALGFDEVWLGEHHSAGSEIISSPEVFIAAAAERAKRIRFGTGVISLAYHNPLWVADRLMLLDHLTHGRVIGGVGPGSLPTDSAMIGLTPTTPVSFSKPTSTSSSVCWPARQSVPKLPPTSFSTPGCSLPRTPTGGFRWRWPLSPRRRARGWPANTASACSPSARR